MAYQYTKSNLLEEPTHYMYSSFEGLTFIEDFKKSRKDFLKSFIIPYLDTRSELKPFTYKIYTFLSKQLTFLDKDLDVAELSLEAPKIDLENTILTEDLINYLIASNLSSTENNNHHLENRLIQKFEVTKKIYNSYEKGLGKGRGDYDDQSLYINFSIFLATKYLANKNLKFLNTLLKVNDIIASAGDSKQLDSYPHELVNLCFNLEINLLDKLMHDKGIK